MPFEVPILEEKLIQHKNNKQKHIFKINEVRNYKNQLVEEVKVRLKIYN